MCPPPAVRRWLRPPAVRGITDAQQANLDAGINSMYFTRMQTDRRQMRSSSHNWRQCRHPAMVSGMAVRSAATSWVEESQIGRRNWRMSHFHSTCLRPGVICDTPSVCLNVSCDPLYGMYVYVGFQQRGLPFVFRYAKRCSRGSDILRYIYYTHAPMHIVLYMTSE